MTLPATATSQRIKEILSSLGIHSLRLLRQIQPNIFLIKVTVKQR